MIRRLRRQASLCRRGPCRWSASAAGAHCQETGATLLRLGSEGSAERVQLSEAGSRIPQQRPRQSGAPAACRLLCRRLHHHLLEVLRGPESNLLTGLDLDGLASGGIATHARRALPHLQDAETGDADTGALL